MTSDCFAADPNGLILRQRHVMLGEFTRTIIPKGMRTTFTTLGFDDICRVDDVGKLLIFNKVGGVYYLGSDKNLPEMNRATVVIGLSGRADLGNLSWGKEVWTKPKKENISGVNCDYFETKKNGNTWQLWVLKDPSKPAWFYHAFSQWLRLPNLGGLPIRAVKINSGGSKMVVLELLGAVKGAISNDVLKAPTNLRRVTNLTEVTTAHDSFVNDVLDTLK